MKKTEREKLKQQLNAEVSTEINRGQQRRGNGNIDREIKKILDANDKKYDDMAEIIKAIRHIIPYDRMLVSRDGYLIPLEDMYFRDNAQTMGFKHGGYITCVGYITNVIGETSESTTDNVFSNLQTLVNQAMISMLPTKEKDLFVVHPIALYYGL